MRECLEAAAQKDGGRRKKRQYYRLDLENGDAEKRVGTSRLLVPPPIESILPTQLNGPKAISRPTASPDERTIIQGARAVTARFSHSAAGYLGSESAFCAHNPGRLRSRKRAGDYRGGMWCSNGDNGTRDLRVEKER